MISRLFYLGPRRCPGSCDTNGKQLHETCPHVNAYPANVYSKTRDILEKERSPDTIPQAAAVQNPVPGCSTT
jgi:hypothetical protein